MMTPSNRRMMVLGVAALALGGVVFAAVSGDRGPRHGGRDDESARLITKNLELSRHFTRAVTANTIRALRAKVGAGDVAVLARMLADECGTVRVAAAALLALAGPGGEAALKRMAAAGDIPASMHARDALMHIGQCRDPRIKNLDRTLCPAPAKNP